MTGTGTQQDPYIITTLQDLDDVRENLSAYYELGANIDASASAAMNDGKGWEAIGTDVAPFTGHFDGKGFEIYGLAMEDDAKKSYALFGVADGATLKNVVLRGFNIIGRTGDSGGPGGRALYEGHAGLVVWARNGSTIENVAVVECNFSKYPGGNIFSAFAAGVVCYLQDSTMSKCASRWNKFGAIDPEDSQGRYPCMVGGLASIIQDSHVSDCYAHGNIIYHHYFGGGAFFNSAVGDSTVDKCWAHLDNDSQSDCGPFGTENINSYFNVLGHIDEEEVTDCYYENNPRFSYGTTNPYGTAKTDAQLRQQATFNGWDFVNTWRMIDGHTYPFLRSMGLFTPTTIAAIALGTTLKTTTIDANSEGTDEKGITLQANAVSIYSPSVVITANAIGTLASTLQGSGTEEDPYLISNLTELNLVRDELDAHYKLIADIDATDTEEWGTSGGFTGWVPIGTTQNPFTGVFDGDGHKIIGLYIRYDTGGPYRIGLFGSTNGATIKNLVVQDVNIAGTQFLNDDDPTVYIGAVVGWAQNSTIEMVGAVGGSIQGDRVSFDAPSVWMGSMDSAIGGLIGLSTNSTISRCYVEDVTLSGFTCVGGFVGFLGGGNTSNCYAEANIQGGAAAASGGFAAYTPLGNATPTVNYCYAASTMFSSASIRVGGWIGWERAIIGDTSYWDSTKKSSGGSSGNTATPGVLGAQGRTTAQMRQQATYVGWQFGTVWTINEGNDYPKLITGFPEEKETTITANAVSVGPIQSTRLANARGQATRSTTINANANGLMGGTVSLGANAIGHGTRRLSIQANAQSKDSKEQKTIQANAIGAESRQRMTLAANAVSAESTERITISAAAIGVPITQSSTRQANAFASDPQEADFAWPCDLSRIEREIEFPTLITEFESGREQRRSKREPRRTWRVRFRKEQAAASDIWSFYVNHRGPFISFTWRDPLTNELVRVRFAQMIYSESVMWKALYETGIVFLEVLDEE